MLARKLKCDISEVPQDRTIKEIVKEKSTLQNEIVGDLETEFHSVPDKAEDVVLSDLSDSLNIKHPGKLGKYSSALISRMVGAKFPGGFGLSSITDYLSNRWGLQTLISDEVLLLGTTMEPAGRFGTEEDAKMWLDSVTQKHAEHSGIPFLDDSAVHGNP